MSAAKASVYEYVVTGLVKQRTVYNSDAGLTSALNTLFPNDTAYEFRFTLDLSEQSTINNTATLRSYGNTTAFISGSLRFGTVETPVYVATLTGMGDITVRNDENIGTIMSPILIDSFNISSAFVTGSDLDSGTYVLDGLDFALSTVENSSPKALFDSTDMPLAFDRTLVRTSNTAVRLFFREVGGDESLGFVGGGWGNNSNTPGTFTVTAVPEPASAVALAGLATLGFVLLRRRRR